MPSKHARISPGLRTAVRWASRLGFVAIAGLIGLSVVLMETTTLDLDRLPAGFREVDVARGLTFPTAVSFAPDGTAFVAEKSGRIFSFPAGRPDDRRLVANLAGRVHNWSERGLLGLALDPAYPERPYLYALYTLDARRGEEPPLWGTANGLDDDCPGWGDGNGVGCIATGELDRLEIRDGRAVERTEILRAWCVQYNTHSVGDLVFGPDDALYVSAGDGANWRIPDYGQLGTAANRCESGPAPTLANAAGGSLRAQAPEHPEMPQTYDGTILRIEPAQSGLATIGPIGDGPGTSPRPTIVAYGLKQPYRMSLDSDGTLWIGEVGHRTFEEVNALSTTAEKGPVNFGWPCYEGDGRQTDYNREGPRVETSGLCSALYADGGDDRVRPPAFAYRHYAPLTAGDGCALEGSAIAGVLRYEGTSYPTQYRGALFFSDFSRSCMWTIRGDEPGRLERPSRKRFLWGTGVVDLERMPGGDIAYVDLIRGAVVRLAYASGDEQ